MAHAAHDWICALNETDRVRCCLANQSHCVCGPSVIFKRRIESQDAFVDGGDGLVEEYQLLIYLLYVIRHGVIWIHSESGEVIFFLEKEVVCLCVCVNFVLCARVAGGMLGIESTGKERV